MITSLVFLFAPSIAESRLPPLTGWKIEDNLGSGYGELTVTNGNYQDVVAVLVDRMGKIYNAVYIKSGDTYTIKDIAENTYYLYFAQGKDWDRSTNSFSEAMGFFKISEPIKFEVVESSDEIKYTTWEFALPANANEVNGIESINQFEFPILNK